MRLWLGGLVRGRARSTCEKMSKVVTLQLAREKKSQVKL